MTQGVSIALFPGDGIGPEVIAEAVAVLDLVLPRHGVAAEFSNGTIGGAAIDACGDPLPAIELERARSGDAVLLGAVGGPKWDDPKATVRPEQGILGLRKGLGVYANLRPARGPGSRASIRGWSSPGARRRSARRGRAGPPPSRGGFAGRR